MDIDYINDRRNYHVGKLLRKLGGRDADPDLQIAIKRSFSEYAEDIITKKDNSNDQENEEAGKFNR